jgi:hypothetical protein
MHDRRLTTGVIRLLVAVCLCISGAGLAVTASAPRVPLFSGGAQSLGRFVIADFDGDQKPDFAIVNVDRSHIELTEYSIHLQLSLGFESAIGLTAPSGGLWLSSRDVNGDDQLDVVVRTTRNSNLVAVLINDGHGRFTVAKPELFPALENEPGIYLDSEPRRQAERILSLPSRRPVGDSAESQPIGRMKTDAEPLKVEKEKKFSNLFAHSNSGRAPPEFS